MKKESGISSTEPTQGGNLNPQAPPFNSTSLFTESSGPILLQTAQAVVLKVNSIKCN